MGTEKKLYLKHPTDQGRLLEVTTIYSYVRGGRIVYEVYLKGSNQPYDTFEADGLLKSLEAV